MKCFIRHCFLFLAVVGFSHSIFANNFRSIAESELPRSHLLPDGMAFVLGIHSAGDRWQNANGQWTSVDSLDPYVLFQRARSWVAEQGWESRDADRYESLAMKRFCLMRDLLGVIRDLGLNWSFIAGQASDGTYIFRGTLLSKAILIRNEPEARIYLVNCIYEVLDPEGKILWSSKEIVQFIPKNVCTNSLLDLAEAAARLLGLGW